MIYQKGMKLGTETKPDSLEQVPERDAEHQGRDGSPDKESPVPGGPPERIFQFAPVVKADRTEKQGPQHQNHREIKPRERGGIDKGPGREDGTSGRDEPDLIAFPVRTDAVQKHPSLGIRSSQKRKQGADPQIESVHDGKAGHQKEDHPPPENLERCILKHDGLLPQLRRTGDPLDVPALPRRTGLYAGRPDPGGHI